MKFSLRKIFHSFVAEKGSSLFIFFFISVKNLSYNYVHDAVHVVTHYYYYCYWHEHSQNFSICLYMILFDFALNKVIHRGFYVYNDWGGWLCFHSHIHMYTDIDYISAAVIVGTWRIILNLNSEREGFLLSARTRVSLSTVNSTYILRATPG